MIDMLNSFLRDASSSVLHDPNVCISWVQLETLQPTQLFR